MINSPVPEETLSPQMSAEKIKEEENKRQVKALLSDLVRFPKFASEVKPEAVKKALPLTLGIGIGGWIVEVEESAQVTSYYLLTPNLVKKLIDPKSCVSEDDNPPIELEKAETVGVESHLGRSLQEKLGYLVLSGAKNNCYGGANSGFVSVYKLRTGEKIKLQSNFTRPGTIWKGVSKTGNALGILKGIYGINKPTIVVEYGLYKNAASGLEEVDTTAYFDLQTGQLKQLIRFE